MASRRITRPASTRSSSKADVWADGLQLVGRTLYEVHSQGVDKVRLSRSLTAGQVLGNTKAPGVSWPSTGKTFGGRLRVVDADFGENFSDIGSPAAAFKVVAIPLP